MQNYPSFPRIVRNLLLGCMLALQAPMVAFALDVGSTAPAFELPGRDASVKLTDYRGKVVYLDFWASWCAPCKQSFPWLGELQSKFGGKGLQVIGISVDKKTDDARKFLANTPANFIVAFDESGATPGSYGIRGMPSSILIGADGKVIFEHIGFRDADKADLENKIRHALKEK